MFFYETEDTEDEKETGPPFCQFEKDREAIQDWIPGLSEKDGKGKKKKRPLFPGNRGADGPEAPDRTSRKA